MYLFDPFHYIQRSFDNTNVVISLQSIQLPRIAQEKLLVDEIVVEKNISIVDGIEKIKKKRKQTSKVLSLSDYTSDNKLIYHVISFLKSNNINSLIKLPYYEIIKNIPNNESAIINSKSNFKTSQYYLWQLYESLAALAGFHLNVDDIDCYSAVEVAANPTLAVLEMIYSPDEVALDCFSAMTGSPIRSILLPKVFVLV